MAVKSGTLDFWRTYFRSANSDIFDVIGYAIIVAASDCPKEFRLRRDRIAEKLFSCRLTRCFGCDRVELAVPEEEENDEGGEGFKGSVGSDETFASKESKVNASSIDHSAMNGVSNYSYDEAEALTEEIEEERQMVGEVLRIKEVLTNHQDESDGVLFESLRRLQLMELSVDTLKATEIGRAVSGIRKHGSKQIRHFARALIDGWKKIVDQWVNATATIANGSPDSVNPSAVDEEGLPSPPLDEGALFITQTTSMELSRFFDGMDDDGNPRNNGGFDKNNDNGRKTASENRVPKSRQRPMQETKVAIEDKNQIRKHAAFDRQTKFPNSNSGPGRPPNMGSGHKANGDAKLQCQTELTGVQKMPPAAGLQDKSKYLDEVSVRVKLEATKRKLHEGYQQAENAKKQRTIQVMELNDLPKRGPVNMNNNAKPRFHNRNWPNGWH